ncbi:MAG: CTP synthase C-terminal region-related (seleno)protein [Granulosicoccaceae bacterium]
MSISKSIALIGDYKPEVLAHQAIPLVLAQASRVVGAESQGIWVATDKLAQTDLHAFDGIWCVPASPYVDMAGALTAIRFAREQQIPFLGTCGGYQHAALEYARHVLGHAQAGNAEVDPDTAMPLISGLSCKLVEKTDRIQLTEGSLVASLYEATDIEEDYHCSFGVNRDYLPLFASSAMRFSGFDRDGDPRVLELQNHPFFIGTAFQPERAGLADRSHPLIEAFLKAC